MVYDYTAYFQQLLERVNSAVTVPFREVQLNGGEPQLNECHNNVGSWVKDHPKKARPCGDGYFGHLMELGATPSWHIL